MKVCIQRRGFLRNRNGLLARIYASDPLYRKDSDAIIRLFLHSSSAVARRAESLTVEVISPQGGTLVSAILIFADALPGTMQIAFFAALPDAEEAVAQFMQRARTIAVERKCGEIVAGMNGHVNYGIGFLVGPYDKPPTFGSSYNPAYYAAYMRKHMQRETRLVSYAYNFDATDRIAEARLLHRLERRFQFRCADFRRLREEVGIYTRLNNACFEAHPFYFRRYPEEDLELLARFRPLITGENLLIAEHAGRPVGFLLWYPDFHELVAPRHAVGVVAAMRYRLLHKPVSHAKVAELGVLPAFQGQGVSVGLIALFHRLARGRFRTCESGWIQEGNQRSLALCKHWNAASARTYAVYETTLES